VAVGDPAKILPPDAHDKIWEIQEPLNFPLAVYGYDRSEASMERITRRLSKELGPDFPDGAAKIDEGGFFEGKKAVPPDDLPVYRLLRGSDDSSSCRKVSEILVLGYKLYGSPSATFNGKDVIVAQAVNWPTDPSSISAFAGRTPSE
jgi:hypothetical protein